MLKVQLGYGVLLDYSGMNTAGRAFCSYAHRMFPTEAAAEDYAKNIIGPGPTTKIVEVWINDPDQYPDPE
jgi:hypothetical protein